MNSINTLNINKNEYNEIIKLIMPKVSTIINDNIKELNFAFS